MAQTSDRPSVPQCEALGVNGGNVECWLLQAIRAGCRLPSFVGGRVKRESTVWLGQAAGTARIHSYSSSSSGGSRSAASTETGRYAWEPWHFGYTRNTGSASVGFGRPSGAGPGGDGRSSIPSFVPERFREAIARAAQRWNVGAALLSAQIYVESNFNPFARSPAGAQGIAQFMPGTAAALGLRNPFDAEQAIDAQAHLMRDLLGRFGSVPLALAAYNAGPGAVAGCACIPPYPETQAYVAKILGLLGGASDLPVALRFEVRLVE
jgi:Transglycosylase SLT domain